MGGRRRHTREASQNIGHVVNGLAVRGGGIVLVSEAEANYRLLG